jgi:AAA15 family ATPase/GTPase
LSLTATKLKGRTEGLIESEYAPEKAVLPVAVVYGPNASGKTNLLRAFRFLQSAVLRSHSATSDEPKVPRSTFALCKDSESKPSEFEVVFETKGVLYQFGFACLNDRFSREWLYAYPRGRRQVWYERSDQEFVFGANFKGQNKVISNLVRQDSLFLSTAFQNAHEQASVVRNYLKNIQYHATDGVSSMEIARHFSNKELDQRILTFLQSAQIGIDEIKVQKSEVPAEAQELSGKLNKLINEFLSSHIDQPLKFDNKDELVELKLRHVGEGGMRRWFDLDDESSGTQRLLILLSKTLDVLDQGMPLIVDELDASVHTKICELIIGLFAHKHTNPLGAQLITTTHDTNLLSSTEIRRDEVWFMEKSESGSSELFSLNDIRVRDEDNFEKAYLEGRFGAIPKESGFLWE